MRQDPIGFRPLLIVSILSVTFGCGGNEGPGEPTARASASSPAGDSAGGTGRSEAEAPGSSEASVEAQPSDGESAPGALRVDSFEVHPVGVSEAENGQGEVVLALEPVALDLHADGWPDRAQSPVLHVGSLRFEQYEHPTPDVLRYVVANAGSLPEGEPVALQYGTDGDSRIVVTESFQLP